MAAPNILIVGSANIDLVTRVPRCPKAGESLIGSSFTTICGGKGANQAVAAARLGATTHFAGCVGNDPFGAMQRTALETEGIDLTHLRTHPGQPTGTAVILVADEGQNSIVVTPSANYGFSPSDAATLGPLFDRLDAVLLQLEIPLDTVETTLDLAKQSGVLSILDAGPAQKVPEALIRKADIISPNETEAEAMTGIAVTSVDDAREAAERLRAMGAGEVVVKLGAQGAFYLGEEAYRVPAFTVDAVDTVAAGDAFTAALAVALAGGAMTRRDAITFANAAGALAATVHGAQPSMPARAAVAAFLSERTGNR